MTRTKEGTPGARGPMAQAERRNHAQQPRLAAFIAMTLSAMVGALIALAATTNVPQVTRAPGTIVPTSNYTQIESLDGGIVHEVYVVDGEIIEAGTPLLRLRHPDIESEAETLAGDISALEQRVENGHAILAALETGHLPQSSDIGALLSRGLSKAAARLQVYADSQRIKAASIAQQEATIAILRRAASFATQRADKKEASLEASRSLLEQRLKTVRDFQDEEHRAETLRAAAADAEVRLAEAESALMLAMAERESETLTLRAETLTELVDLEEEEARLAAHRAALRAKLDGLVVTAPVGGIVHTVAYPNPGEVIEPGETLFELMPTQQQLFAEVRIPNRDIGHVDPSHPVSVSVDTFDVRRYGKVEGHMLSLSPLPIEDAQTGAQYFRASVALTGTGVGVGAYERPLQAGMTVVAEMITGEQSLLWYFLKPVHLTLQSAFNER